ncbi:MAG: class I SAM-dependent methyltransferase [Oscillatoriaceae bacterium SKW80]|nr:class I SAM-dependent methyltransferase [Oscillatoriaceae bacterium SKYG93]MCX8122023.1 class I SAM-dependent methyltransferase [Oscillatoriaceae bacterium SKW80]MDW8454310.1 class I SAM-dependent methyltransferase [Oscillatoriaceae cyanobacterium SKYGB_i_bin93]HIK29175.1 methyltransferase domain-containing protein [Oscillatoriaceae cyanobacterium M7585_C2015_266]
MNKIEFIQQKKAEIISQYGEWTNHNIQLAGDLYTIDKEAVTGAEVKLKRIVQMIADISGQAFEKLRVLDLACLEGLYGIELALQGAKVVAIEARQANLEKARLAKEALSLDNIEFIQDDVRNLSPEKYGRFDIVLCLGILYHLDVPDVFHFLEQIGNVCKKIVIIDTHVSKQPEICYNYKNKKYWGSNYQEVPNTVWSSLDNEKSFWLTRASLYNMLWQCGFTSVYECHAPVVRKYEVMRIKQQADRTTFMAIKGKRVFLRSLPQINQWPADDSLENQELL